MTNDGTKWYTRWLPVSPFYGREPGDSDILSLSSVLDLRGLLPNGDETDDTKGIKLTLIGFQKENIFKMRKYLKSELKDTQKKHFFSF